MVPPQGHARCRDAGEAGRLLRALEDGDGVNMTERRIGRYVVDRLIGSGGSGSVYRGYADGSDSPLAIKLLSRALSSESRSRALREAEVLGSLRLQCVPRFIDSGLHRGAPFIVTEFIDGPSLGDLVEGMNREDRVALLARVAAAVQLLHEHGVLHRDLKPANILIDAKRNPVIVDLGLAHSDARDHTLTAEGQPLGTIAFMSPEQARGNLAEVSTRSDVYSLGAIGYQLEVGQPPHDVNTSIHEAIRRIAQEPPRDPRSLRPDLPRRLAAVLAKACAAKPADRYTSAAAFGDDLRRWLRGEAVDAIAPGPWRRSMRWAAGHPLVVTIMACFVIAASSLVATVLSVKWLNDRPYTIRVEGDYSARLVSRTGKTLHEWPSRGRAGPIFGMVVDRPAEFGGGRVALLGFQAGLYGDLRACDVEAPDRTLWSRGGDPGDLVIPPPYRFDSPPPFGVQHAQALDIFPESPGLEVVALHRSNSTGIAAIRIYDLSGRTLFEAWHPGVLYELYWMEGPGLLVLAGVNSEALWKLRGEPGTRDEWPWIVFAIRLNMNARQGWIATPSRPGNFTPEWYRCVMPPNAADRFMDDTQLRVQAPELHNPRTHADVQAGLVCLTIDSHGVVQRKLVMATERQRMTPADEALYQALCLGDLPPIAPTKQP